MSDIIFFPKATLSRVEQYLGKIVKLSGTRYSYGVDAEDVTNKIREAIEYNKHNNTDKATNILEGLLGKSTM
jgi:hypothetical protein